MRETAATDVERPRARPLGLADAMIFIVALGLGLAVARIQIVGDVRSAARWQFLTLAGAVSLGRGLNIILLNFLFFLLPAFLLVRLRRPRPALRSLVSQPGFVACAVPVVIALATLPFALFPTSGLTEEVIEIVVQVLMVAAAPLAWVFLIVTRRWNPEPGWIDRLGRILGALGMVCTPAHFVLIHLT